MKVKNIVFSGFVAAVLMGVVADANAVTHVVTKGYIDDLTNTVLADTGKYVTGVTQTKGRVESVATAGFDQSISSDSGHTNAPTSRAVYEYVEAHDDNTTYTGSGYVSIDTNNNITVNDVTDAGSGIDANDDGLTTGKAVFEYVTNNDTDTTYTAGSHITITGEDNSIAVNDVTDAGGDINATDTGLTTGKAVYEYVTQLTGAVLPDGCTSGNCSLVKLGGVLQWVDLTTPLDDQ